MEKIQIFTLRQLGEKVIGKNKTMRMVSVDLEKAFDRVDRNRATIARFREIWCQREVEGKCGVTVLPK